MNSCFKTKDLPLAAYLFLHQPKIRLEGIEIADRRSYWFLFSPPGKADLLANKFFTGRGKVNPQAYASAQRSLKDIVFQKERQQVTAA